MKEYVLKEVTESKVAELSVSCDICGGDAESTEHEEADSSFHSLDIYMSIAEGEKYPDGNYREEVEIDVCSICFRKKLIPWVESFGKRKIEFTDEDECMFDKYRRQLSRNK